MKHPHPTHTALLVALSLSLGLLGACSSARRPAPPSEQQTRAMAMWKERCQGAGEKIHKTVDNVEGIYLLKLRPENVNYSNQFRLDDPYGSDLLGDGYIRSFIRGSFRGAKGGPSPEGYPPRIGYAYVEATDPEDGVRYRYTGRIDQPWLRDKSYGEWVRDFVMDKVPAPGPAPRYGVTYDDISTREEREHWIAGSSLKVIDLQTNEVIAERIGYMVDWAQGSNAGGRSPWLFAANNACPDFYRNRSNVSAEERRHSFSGQSYQTLDFVEKVLKPRQ